jgi:hypothetical protein
VTKTPGYWMHETSGALRPAIAAYLNGGPMTPTDIAARRAYLRQWIEPNVWDDVDELREGVDGLTSREAIHEWLMDALEIGIDPL